MKHTRTSVEEYANTRRLISYKRQYKYYLDHDVFIAKTKVLAKLLSTRRKFLGCYSYRAVALNKKLKQNLSYRDSSPDISFNKIFIRSKLTKLPLTSHSHDRIKFCVKCLFLSLIYAHTFI